jgi:hypothetical protein
MCGIGNAKKIQELKKKLTTMPVLVLPKPSRSFVVFCDASKRGLDGVLMQDGRVVTNASRQLKIH